MGLGAYLDLALIFLLLRFSLLILFFLHLALIALAHFWNNQVVTRRPKRLLLNTRGQYMDLELDGFGGGFSLGLGLLVGLVLLALALLLNLRGIIDRG